jgi:hypothetical protein
MIRIFLSFFAWMREMEDTYVSREAWLERMSDLAEFDGIDQWTLGRVAGPVRAKHDTS